MGFFSSKETQLLDAAFIADFDKVKKLVERGANINAKNNKGTSVLMAASCSPPGLLGAVNVVNFLLEKGADINAINEQGDTALICATKMQILDVVALLIAKGADRNIKNHSGRTALMEAEDGFSSVARDILSLLKRE